MRRLVLTLVVLSACQRQASSPSRLPEVGPGLRAAIGDVDGDRRGEIAIADAGELRLLDRAGRQLAAMPAPGGIQALAIADLDGDGRGEIAAGWGRDRDHGEATARVSLLHLESGALREEVVAAPESERPQIAAIVPAPPDLFIAWYDSQYTVKSAFARRAGDGKSWRLDEVAVIRTAGSYALGDVDGDGQRDLVVGRFYGDEQASDGDAFLLRPGGARVAVPTTRGVHAIALADFDGDGQSELLLADGWHKDYGHQARAHLTWDRWRDGAFESDGIVEIPGDYTIWALLAADLDGDRRPELVARGSGSVWVYSVDRDGGWNGNKVAGEAADIATGEIDGAPGDELLVVAPGGSQWIARK